MSVKKAIDLEGFLRRNSQILESSDPTFKISKRGIEFLNLPRLHTLDGIDREQGILTSVEAGCRDWVSR